MKKSLQIVMAMLMLAMGIPAVAQGAESPVSTKEWAFPKQVGYKDVAPLVTIPRPKNVLIIDSRPYEGRYVPGYIPTAVSLPDSSFDKNAKEVLPADKNTRLVFYCQGIECTLSHQSAFKAQKMGYKNVEVYTGGLPDWEAQGGIPAVTVEHLKKLMETSAPYMLVDSRPVNKFLEGSIPTAISIADTQFDARKGLLPIDKNTLLVFFCGGYDCVLSHNSANKAKALGYTNIAIAEGGEPAWKAKYGSGAAIGVAKENPNEGLYPVIQFEKELKSGKPPFMLIDPRPAVEFKAGTLPGAVNIPTDVLESKIDSLPKDKPVVFACTSGSRAGEAYYMVMDKLPAAKNIYYLEASIKYLDGGAYTITPNK